MSAISARYTLEWLDHLVFVSLNPGKSNIEPILPEQIILLEEKIADEKIRQQSFLMNVVFSLREENKISMFIRQYHSTLVIFLDQALRNYKVSVNKSTHKQSLNAVERPLNAVISFIEEMLSFIGSRFSTFLGMDERVPATDVQRFKKVLIKKQLAITKKLSSCKFAEPALEIIIMELRRSINLERNDYPYTYREIFYLKDLFDGLQGLNANIEKGVYSALDEFLIQMNFNSKSYIWNLTKKVIDHVNLTEQPSEKMERLLFHYKLFKQFYKRSGMVFNIKEASLHKQMDNWFLQEIFYLEKRNTILPKVNEKDRLSKIEVKNKIRSTLSVDQLALILRAADDTRTIIARSLSSVFKSLAPHLATTQKEDISFDSMRSKSYSAELRDKEVVIQMLRQMIDKIKDY
jgi:hypothetical protein